MSRKNYVYKTAKGQAFHDYEEAVEDIMDRFVTEIANAIESIVFMENFGSPTDWKRFWKIMLKSLQKSLAENGYPVTDEYLDQFLLAMTNNLNEGS